MLNAVALMERLKKIPTQKEQNESPKPSENNLPLTAQVLTCQVDNTNSHKITAHLIYQDELQ